MGSPPFPSAAQVATLREASVPSVVALDRTAWGDAVKVTVEPASLAVVAL